MVMLRHDRDLLRVELRTKAPSVGTKVRNVILKYFDSRPVFMFDVLDRAPLVMVIYEEQGLGQFIETFDPAGEPLAKYQLSRETET